MEMPAKDVSNIWVVVDVMRGFAAGAEAYSTEAQALKRLRCLAKNTNFHENDIDVFNLEIGKSYLKR